MGMLLWLAAVRLSRSGTVASNGGPAGPGSPDRERDTAGGCVNDCEPAPPRRDTTGSLVYVLGVEIAPPPMTPKQITRKLTNAGFPMDALVEINRDEVVIGYATEGVVELQDRERTEQAVTVAEEILGWGGFSCAWGGWVLKAGYQVDEFAGTVYGREHY